MNNKEYNSKMLELLNINWETIANLDTAILEAHQIIEDHNHVVLNLSYDDIASIKGLLCV